MGRGIEPGDDAHGGGFPCAVGAEEPGDDAGLDGERDAVHRGLVTVLFRQPIDFDHFGSSIMDARSKAVLSSMPWTLGATKARLVVREGDLRAGGSTPVPDAVLDAEDSQRGVDDHLALL